MYQAVELSVNDRLIRGVVRGPEGKGPFPAVIFHHGFTVDKVGMMRLHELFARECVKAGFVCVRFDFYGLGESDGDFNEMTIGKELEEAEAIYQWTCSQPYIDEKQVVISGHSMGGLIATLVAPKVNPAGLLLWSPALTMYYQAGLRARTLVGPTEKGWDIGGMELGREFMEEAATMDFLQMAYGYDGPVLILHGSQDEQIPVDVVGRYQYLYKDQCKAVIVEGANHQFSSLKWKGQVYEESIRFITELTKGADR
ncbi:MAG: alpha/beta fold hydrolase [Firmicutes bacterium]|jgi:hypothetical protein|nr:alpha/beta fold hydrolase [Bacillota bacterium]